MILSTTLFIRLKFACNLLTYNRRGNFNRERRRHIKIFQVFICWKAPSIIRYRRVRLGILWLGEKLQAICKLSKLFNKVDMLIYCLKPRSNGCFLAKHSQCWRKLKCRLNFIFTSWLSTFFDRFYQKGYFSYIPFWYSYFLFSH